ncbi:hypothetical protein Ac2012v2_000940 [Leucoagaricus gongylophorus]
MAAPGVKPDRRGHVCPPSGAMHPSDRWESLFVYSFILKFTNLKAKTLGFESVMDFEDALLSREPNDILTKILGRFILNLKPQTRNLSTDQISMTLMGVLSEYFKTNERTVFWNDDIKANVDPFQGEESGFFAADWNLKLTTLRQLVELQLGHSQEVKAAIDRAWGIVHNKHKKEKGSAVPAFSSSTREALDFPPFGMDHKRERYWVADDSPRIYTSTNPWRLTASFKAVSSTREEYLAVIDHLKAVLPVSKGKRRPKNEQNHADLIHRLEQRIGTIDQEINRVAKVRKKVEQNKALVAQAELRSTRTRRQSQKPDYVYYSQESEDEYQFQEQEDEDFQDDEEQEEKSRRREVPAATRRSTRTVVLNAHGKRESSADSNLGSWRGERRSARLGFQDPFEPDERLPKRARTEESMASVGSADASPASTVQTQSATNANGTETKKGKLKATGAAALKPTEMIVEQVAGKKKSKFWIYAVEPVRESENEYDGEDGRMKKDGDINGHGSTNGCGRLHVDQSRVVESTA